MGTIKRRSRAMLLLGASALLTTFSPSLLASSHREAPSITGTPKLDGTDFYMFRSYEPGRQNYVTLIANYIPLQDPYGGPNYFKMEQQGLYEIHLDNTGNGVEDITFQFRFNNKNQNLTVNAGGVDVPIALNDAGQIGRGGNPKDIANLNVQESYTLSIIRGGLNGTSQRIVNAADGIGKFEKPSDNIGFKTLPDYIAYANAHVYDVRIPGCGNGRVFVGQRKDPFVVNLGETFDLINIAHPIGEQYANAGRDDLADKNVTSLILEVPISCVKGTDPVIGGWTTSSWTRNAAGARGAQVSRLGMPLVNEVVIGLNDKDAFNSSQPAFDARFATYVTNPSFPTIVGSVFAAAGVQAPTLFPRTDLVATFLTGLPGINQPAKVKPAEELRLNTSTPVTPAAQQNRLGVIGGDPAGFPNGRRPGDDVVDVTLRVAMGRLITLGLFGTPSQAPSGQLDFTDGAIVNSSFFDAQFPYLKPPIPGSPGASQPSQPMPADAVLPGLNPIAAQ